jgi:hypothetical protein
MKLNEVNSLNTLLDTIKLKDFSVDDLKALLALKKETKAIIENMMELKIEVAKKFEIVPINGIYDYVGSPKAAEIEKTMLEIDKGPFELKAKTKFISFEQLKSALQENHNIDNLLVLSEYLVKD